MANLIELKNISLQYKHHGRTLLVLKDVNLSFKKGEIVAILGPSGSGKSTLLYILGCLLKPSSGQYSFAGTQMSRQTTTELADFRAQKIGFVFQQFHLLPRANLIENLLLSSRYAQRLNQQFADLRLKAKELLTVVGLSEHLSHYPNELSGGQQQRVAIARALMNDPELILADEPTGNLDSQSAIQIIQLLRKIQQTGKTVIIITHDRDIANQCDRIIKFQDGMIVSAATVAPSPVSQIQITTPAPLSPQHPPHTNSIDFVDQGGMEAGAKAHTEEQTLCAAQTDRLSSGGLRSQWNWYQRPRWRDSHWLQDIFTSWQNLTRNKSRSLLTMLGVTIGVAAVLATVTLGTYTEKKILESYESLGVNRLVVRAYPKWNIAAKDLKGPKFEGISQTNDIGPIRKIFPEIRLVSPVVHDWITSVEFGGKTFDQARILGINEEYFTITNRQFLLGRPFSRYHVANRSRVCVIGSEVATRLFANISAVGQILQVNGNNNLRYSCQILGVLASQSSNNEWFNPNQQILFPDTYLSLMANRWNSKPNELNIQVSASASLADLGTKIKQFFHLKYGRSVEVAVDSDTLLIAQMRHFLNLFSILLAGVALISLGVGGIGIANMMMVSVTERIKEIGLRKALGARDADIHRQFLIESTILCSLAGLLGLLAGILGYHLVLYLASKLFPQIHFEWIFNFLAMTLSLLSILGVGLLSGIVPALRAERLQVVDALRSE